MRKLYLLPLIVLFASCVTFGVKNTSFADGREGRDYTLTANAWDKKATDVSIIFAYRFNGGTWKEAKGIFNGRLYEAVVRGADVPAGTLEYYAWMINSKGKKISSPPAFVPILSFEQAKQKAARAYLALLSAGSTPKEFIFNEPAVFFLKAGGTERPASAQCSVGTQAGSRLLTAETASTGEYSVAIPAPHTDSSYSYQWSVKWIDGEFGEIVSVFPANAVSVPVLDLETLKMRLVQDFRAAIQASAPVSGNYFEPPAIQAKLNYTPLLRKFSQRQSRVNMLLSRDTFIKTVPMTKTGDDAFNLELPVADLEKGALSYALQYSDTFNLAGKLQAEYPAGGVLQIAYTSFETMKAEAALALRGKFTHTPPTGAVEGVPVQMKVNVLDRSLQIVAVSLYGAGRTPVADNVPFMEKDGAWHAALPGTFIRPGISSYRIVAVIRDPRFGDLRVMLPAADFFAFQAKSLEDAKNERKAELLKTLSHTPPAEAQQNAPIALVLRQTPYANADARLFYLTPGASRYREVRALPENGKWTFAINASDTGGQYIQYYFTVSITDPVLQSVTATFRNFSGSAANDFIIAPIPPAGSGAAPAAVPAPPAAMPAAPAPPPAVPAATPAPPAATPAGPIIPDEPFVPQEWYQGEKDARAGVRFFVRMKKELGLYDVAVMVRISGTDSAFREYSLERRGKEFSFTLDGARLPEGSLIDFYYIVYRKGTSVQTLPANSGNPYRATIGKSTVTGGKEDGDKNNGKKKP